MKKMIWVVGVTLMGLLLVAGLANAQIPQKINFQGKLTDAGGNPVSDPSCNMKFSIYNVETDGIPKWQETQTVPVSNGIFNVRLGKVTPIVPASVPFDEAYWLEVEVYNSDTLSWEKLSRRQPITSVGYALNTDKVKGSALTDNIFPSSGPVGIGTTDPSGYKLKVVGTVYFDNNVTIADTGSLSVDTISEKTSESGVTIDGVLLRDSGVSTDSISEKNSNEGVTIDSVLHADSGITVDSDKFVVAETGDTAIKGTLTVSGTAHSSFSGYVGIGTTEPNELLHVAKGSKTSGITTIASFSTTESSEELALHIKAVGGESSEERGIQLVSTENYLGENFLDLGELGTEGTTAVRITSDGNVGIGTTRPNRKLAVTGTLFGGGTVFGIDIRDAATRGTVISSAYSPDVAGKNAIPLTINAHSGVDYPTFLSLQTGGEDRIFINSEGDVGIGTTGPQSKLHLLVPDDGGIRIQAGEDGWGAARLEFYSDPIGDANEWRPGYITSADSEDFTGRLDFYTNGAGEGQKTGSVLGMSIENGNVGIGTTAPNMTLEVNGNIRTTSYTQAIFANNINSISNSVDLVLTAGNSADIVLANGNVGIGTASPGAKLDVEVSSGGAATFGNSGCSATGDYAVAMGLNTDASGPRSLAVGDGATASGPDSVAVGDGATASGSESMAIGWDTHAANSGTLATGWQSTASGLRSVAMGAQSIAAGSYSVAMGRRAKANSAGAFVFADSQEGNYNSNGANTFNIRASGGVYYGSDKKWDIAEEMRVCKADNVQEAELVSLCGNDVFGKTKAAYDENLVGVVTSNKTTSFHLQSLEELTDPNLEKKYITLVGRVYVKVNNQNGQMRVGDPITSSDAPGIGMKADRICKIVGYAMEDADFDGNGSDEILVFVNLGYYVQEDEFKELKQRIEQLELALKK